MYNGKINYTKVIQCFFDLNCQPLICLLPDRIKHRRGQTTVWVFCWLGWYEANSQGSPFPSSYKAPWPNFNRGIGYPCARRRSALLQTQSSPGPPSPEDFLAGAVLLKDRDGSYPIPLAWVYYPAEHSGRPRQYRHPAASIHPHDEQK